MLKEHWSYKRLDGKNRNETRGFSFLEEMTYLSLIVNVASNVEQLEHVVLKDWVPRYRMDLSCFPVPSVEFE